LVDKGIARGVFTSWDAAEAFADEHRLSLDQLMEYETQADHPDHLHLLAAKWDGPWTFQGEWTKQTPNWLKPPEKVRLDHYHAKGDGFALLREREFKWEPNLLLKVNPMAPEEALKSDIPTQGPGKAAQWKPKLSPLKPLQPSAAQAKPEEETPEQDQASPEKEAETAAPDKRGATSSKALIDGPEPPAEDPLKKQASIPDFPKLTPQKPPKLLKPSDKDKATKKPQKETPKAVPSRPEPKIAFQKKKALKLKPKEIPEPIPSFKPSSQATDIMGNAPSSVELAQEQTEAQIRAEEEERQAAIKVKRVWSIRLILTTVVVVACWASGIFWVLKPEPTAANVLAGVNSLNSARMKVMEPEMVFFQLPVDPAYQERWIQSLGLMALDPESPVAIPTYHSLDTWENPTGFIRPPYSETEVDEWWNLRLRVVRYGYIHTWDDGSILILDLESDNIIGWAKAKSLPDLMN
jgi:hypothetical protein